MPVIKIKPTSPGRRGVVKVVHPHWYRGKPEASLLEPQMQNAGRNNNGHITIRHRGVVTSITIASSTSWRRKKDAIPAKVERIEYDPNRHGAHRAGLLRRRRSAAT